MNFIKDAITRVSRSARQLESFASSQKVSVAVRPPHEETKARVIHKPNKNLTNEELNQFKPLVKGYQRKVYQDFLEPLQMSNLKVFNDDMPSYNSDLAKFVWAKKTNNERVNVFNNFLEDRIIFNQMMDLLIELTPEYLKSSDLNNAQVLSRILKQQDYQDRINKFPELTPRYHFHEIPPMPLLEHESFQKYIYFLTHSKILYRNSSSLQNGLVSDILLHTHKLTSTKYKPFRSVYTYNYLIKFFGYDKNQSSFARELLLVMNKDGHKPNIDTINNLLKLCQIHSRIRSISNTYQIIIKYLKLSRSMNIEINLTTWNRIYDSIDNIFLKELFINKMVSINLPISKNLSFRILDDYMETTKDTKELITFIENDLQMDWTQDTKLLNKVIYHRAVHTTEDKIASLWDFVSMHQIDNFSVKYLFEGLSKNTALSNKGLLLVSMYAKLDAKLLCNPDIYRVLLSAMCDNSQQFAHDKIAFVLQGLMHDATENLHLPQETTDYESVKTVPENIKIMKRLVGFKLTKFEGKLAYCNKKLKTSTSLSTPLSTREVEEWHSLIGHVNVSGYPAGSHIITALCLEPCTISIPEAQLAKYQQHQNRKAANARDRDRLYKLQHGIDTYTNEQMLERGILP